MYSLVGRMCLEAGNDLWRDWTLAGALGISVVITGRTRPREIGRRGKKARRNPSTILCCGISSVTAIGNYFKNGIWQMKNGRRTVFLKGYIFFLGSLSVDLQGFKK